jgi:hypothetical protein
MTQKFTITKKIAKHGKQAVIVIPSVLQEHVRPDMLVKITMEVIGEGK